MHGLEASYANEINFVYLDIDDPATDRFKRQLGYNYQPHLFLLDGSGEILAQWVGWVSVADLEPAIQASIQ